MDYYVALRKDQLPHARCVILIEACEESGSYDLPPVMATEDLAGHVDYLLDLLEVPDPIPTVSTKVGRNALVSLRKRKKFKRCCLE